MKINLKRLCAELRETPEYQPEDRGAGYQYIYDELYQPFLQGQEVALTAPDFEAFSSEDILVFDDVYYSVLNRSLSRNCDIRRGLQNTAPMASAASFL